MSKKEKLKWIINEILGDDWSLDKFNDKLIIQKSIYLGEILGFDLNYDFGWYVRGVYSSSLTVDLYEMENRLEINYNPSREEQEIMGKLKNIEERFEEDEGKGFELVSTIVYAIKNKKQPREFVEKTKPWFNENKISLAIEKVESLGISS